MAIDITGLPPSPSQNSGESAPTGSARNDVLATPQRAEPTTQTADAVTLTSRANQLKNIEATIGTQSVVDSQRVQSLKSAIASGGYEINASRVAEKFIQFESSLRTT